MEVQAALLVAALASPAVVMMRVLAGSAVVSVFSHDSSVASAADPTQHLLLFQQTPPN
ncbi:hypothetical protein ARZXY2_204 [Arthrobacter sp. ZXY-2]|nr:hypothetical protein ARZXY2_204 [Arthrobacter sp. ZXY-2]